MGAPPTPPPPVPSPWAYARGALASNCAPVLACASRRSPHSANPGAPPPRATTAGVPSPPSSPGAAGALWPAPTVGREAPARPAPVRGSIATVGRAAALSRTHACANSAGQRADRRCTRREPQPRRRWWSRRLPDPSVGVRVDGVTRERRGRGVTMAAATTAAVAMPAARVPAHRRGRCGHPHNYRRRARRRAPVIGACTLQAGCAHGRDAEAGWLWCGCCGDGVQAPRHGGDARAAVRSSGGCQRRARCAVGED